MARQTKRHALTEARIDHIVELMTNLEFRRGRTAKALAKQWGLSPQTVREYTAEASRRVKETVADDGEDIATRIHLTLDRILADAMQDNAERVFADEKTLIANRRLVVEACKAWAAIFGAAAPTKHEVSAPEGTVTGIRVWLPPEEDAEPQRGPVIFLPKEASD